MVKGVVDFRDLLIDSYIDGLLNGVSLCNRKLSEAGVSFRIVVPSKSECFAMYKASKDCKVI